AHTPSLLASDRLRKTAAPESPGRPPPVVIQRKDWPSGGCLPGGRGAASTSVPPGEAAGGIGANQRHRAGRGGGGRRGPGGAGGQLLPAGVRGGARRAGTGPRRGKLAVGTVGLVHAGDAELDDPAPRLPDGGGHRGRLRAQGRRGRPAETARRGAA